MPKLTRELVEQFATRIRNNTLRGKILDPVPVAQTQEGPNCGFYALSIVMDYWKAKGRTGASAPARKRDIALQDRHPGEQNSPSLRHLGKQVGALDMGSASKASTGGVWTANQLASVAKAVRFANFNVRVKKWTSPNSFIFSLCNAIDADIPPIVAFDTREGEPVADEGGQHSHWGVVIGHFTHNGSVCFIATHGHGGYYVWTANALQRSNFALAGTTLAAVLERKITFAGPQLTPGHKLARTHWVSQEKFNKYRLEAPNSGVTVQAVETRARQPVQQDLAYHIVLVEPA